MSTSPLMARILRMLANTEPNELDCQEAFALLDEFVDMQARGEDAAQYLPLVYEHLKICGDCREEYEALLSLVAMEATES